MGHPVILIDDPVTRVYDNFIEHVLQHKTSGINRIDLIVQRRIADSASLNELLFRYYHLIRNVVTEAGYDHTLDINILYNKVLDPTVVKDWNVVYKLRSESNTFKIPEFVRVVQVDIEAQESRYDIFFTTNTDPHRAFATVAVGGTFDHLHDGHKILLSLSSFLTNSKLIVGITGPELLVNKKYSEVLQPFAVRQKSVLDFLALMSNPGDFAVEIYKIKDVCGPTGFVRDIDALVVSSESKKGGEFVNNYRSERQFPELRIVVIRVIGSEDSSEENNWKGKLSSTDIREVEAKRLADSKRAHTAHGFYSLGLVLPT